MNNVEPLTNTFVSSANNFDLYAKFGREPISFIKIKNKSVYYFSVFHKQIVIKIILQNIKC